MRRLAALAVGIALSLLPGCEDDSAAPSSSAATTSRPAPTVRTPPSPHGANYDEADLAVAADYEEEAEKAIDASNYKEKLAAIREELGMEPEEEEVQPAASGSAAAAPTSAPATSAKPPPVKLPTPKAAPKPPTIPAPKLPAPKSPPPTLE